MLEAYPFVNIYREKVEGCVGRAAHEIILEHGSNRRDIGGGIANGNISSSHLRYVCLCIPNGRLDVRRSVNPVRGRDRLKIGIS